MKNSSLAAGIIAAAFLSLLRAPVHAQVVTVTVGGTIQSIVSPAGQTSLLNSSIAPGTPFSYIFTYNANAVPSETSPSGFYNMLPQPSTPQPITIGNYVLEPYDLPGVTAYSGIASVFDNNSDPTVAGLDGLLVDTFGSVSPMTPDGHTPLNFGGFLFLSDPTHKAITSTALPDASVYDLSKFSEASFDFTVATSATQGTTAFGQVTRLSATEVAAVPEPSSLISLAIGALGLALLALRAHRKKASA